MARVKVCGACLKPLRECICDDEKPGEPQDGSEDDAA
jgi:DTW domain-containing protein YfiP